MGFYTLSCGDLKRLLTSHEKHYVHGYYLQVQESFPSGGVMVTSQGMTSSHTYTPLRPIDYRYDTNMTKMLHATWSPRFTQLETLTQHSINPSPYIRMNKTTENQKHKIATIQKQKMAA